MSARLVPSRRAGRGRANALAVLVLVLGALLAAFAGPGAVAAVSPCRTPFLVMTDPGNPGTRRTSGDVTFIADSGLVGDFRGTGRFAGYRIVGSQDAVVNDATSVGQVQGEFTATSPDGGSSLTIRYTGRVDFATGTATGHFVVVGGTGELAGYHAAGTIEGTVVGPATLDGADVGLC